MEVLGDREGGIRKLEELRRDKIGEGSWRGERVRNISKSWELL